MIKSSELVSLFSLSSLIYFISRVSPADEFAEPKAPKAGSARSGKVVLGREFSRQNSSPDPLEPWSTKDLANMNKILDS